MWIDYNRFLSPLSARFQRDNLCMVPFSKTGRAIKVWSRYIKRMFERLDATRLTNEAWRNMEPEQRTRHLIVTRSRQGDYLDDIKTFESGSSASSNEDGYSSPPEDLHAPSPVEPGTTSSN